MFKTMSVKNNKVEMKDYWRHNMILERKKEFIDYLSELTDIETLINNIKTNQILSTLKNNSSVVKNFVDRILTFIDNEIVIDKENYEMWKEQNIKQYVKHFINLIKEEQTFKNEVEINRFRKRMKQQRNSHNFIIESIYSFHNNQRKLVLTRLDKEYNKQEYLNLILIVMNILLTYQYVYNCCGYEFEKTYSVDEEETINKKIKNLNMFSSMVELEILFKWLNSILYQMKFLTDNKGDINNG